MLDLTRIVNRYTHNDPKDKAILIRKCIIYKNTKSDFTKISILFLGEIDRIWADEVEHLPFYTNDYPPLWGVMRSFGYNVGSDGVSSEQRRILLNHIFSATVLPPVKDKTHLSKWGKAESFDRYSKMLRFMEAKKEDDKTREYLDESVGDRLTDIDYFKTVLFPKYFK